MRYNTRSSAVFFAHWLQLDGTESTITGTPTITIYHYDSGSITTDVNAVNMTQLSGSLYYYNWQHTKALRTSYVAVCSGVVSGITVKTSETFTFEDQGAFGVAVGGEGIWTEEEKNNIIKMIKTILNRLPQIQSQTESNFNDINKLISNLQINIEKSNISDEIRSNFTLLQKKLKHLENLTNEQQRILLANTDFKTLERLRRE